MNVAANPWLSHPAVIEEIRPEIASVSTLVLRLENRELAARYRFAPGQFNMLYVPGCGEVAISMSGPAADDGHRIVHTIRSVGRVTQAIEQLGVGEVIGVRGPMGTPWPIESLDGKDVVVVTGGLGMAPLRPVIYSLMADPERYGRRTLLYGARSPDLILYADEIDSWRASGIDVHLTVDRADDDWHGHVGTVPLLIDRLAGVDPARTAMLVCGPEVMMHFSAKSGLARGLPRESIWLSMERNMQCAFGMCGHCQWGSHFVCRNGPVLRYDTAEPFLKVRDL
ncbi:MAG: FAD/NAD(P)-binding protein [Planctomycetota bacterium]